MDRTQLREFLLTFYVDQQLRLTAGKMQRECLTEYNALMEMTLFLPEDIQFNARVYSVIHNMFERPTCLMCNTPTKWSRLFKKGFQQYCSVRCKNLDPVQQEKAKQGVQRKYNVRNVGQLKWVKDKREQTNLKKFGVKHAAQNIEIQQKARNTNIERYKANHAMCLSDFQLKVKRTNMERYGVEYLQQSQFFRNKSIATNRRKLGVEHHMQLHLSPEVLGKLNDKAWLIDQHHIQEKSLLQISNELSFNNDMTTVSRYFQKHGIELKRFQRSIGEKELCFFLTENNIAFEIGNRTIISPMELDVYIPGCSVAIEYNGLYWHSEQAGKDKNYHFNKWDRCRREGIQLITIFEDEWETRRDQVQAKILSVLGKDVRLPIYARKTQVGVVSTSDKKQFFEQTHIQGNGRSSINLGLYYNEELTACASFVKTNDGFLLNRYATKHRVVGGLSKLLKHVTPLLNGLSLFTFADLRWSQGNIYERTGWIQEDIVLPDYCYVVNNRRVHKFNFRRKYLPVRLVHFDSTQSECANCDANNVLRVWDCGKIKYRWNPPKFIKFPSHKYSS